MYEIQVDGLVAAHVRGLRLARRTAAQLGGDVVYRGDSCGWLVLCSGWRKQRRRWASL